MLLEDVPKSYRDAMSVLTANRKPAAETIERFANEGGGTAVGHDKSALAPGQHVKLNGQDFELSDGAVVIAAITRCTNTSNPAVMIAAGLVARKAVEKGLKTQPWVKTSLAPGSKVVTDYLERSRPPDRSRQARLLPRRLRLHDLHRQLGPAAGGDLQGHSRGDLVVASVLSGNRNFEGRVHPEVKANYLASPPLVVAYALAGTIDIDLTKEPLGIGKDGKPVFLKDIWPTQKEIGDMIAKTIGPELFTKSYADVFKGDTRWNSIPSPEGELYKWEPVDVHQESAVLRRHDDADRARSATSTARAARPVRRLDHDRSHLAGRQHQEGFARRAVT